MNKEKEFTYDFLRQEMEDLVARQDNFFSIAYASAAALWTAAISTSSAWVSLITIVLIITFSAKICDIWNGFIFISSYIKSHLEDDAPNDWERMREKYYEKYPFNFRRKMIRKCLKYTFPLLNVISCVIFWGIRATPIELIFTSWDNLLIVIGQLALCVFHFVFWARNYDSDSVRENIDDKWKSIESLSSKCQNNKQLGEK